MNDVHMPVATSEVSGRAWYVTQVKPNCTSIAERNLVRVGCSVFAPYEELTLRRGSQFRQTNKPLFPGYLFVSFDPAAVPWRSVNSTHGVARLVSFASDRPAVIPNSLIAGLMQRCNASGRLRKGNLIEMGDQVLISSGPFADFIGTVEMISERERIWVLLEVLGARRKVEINALDARVVGKLVPDAVASH